MSRGNLFLVGGKDGRNGDRVLIDRFVRMCGGASARVLVITSASRHPNAITRNTPERFMSRGTGRVDLPHRGTRRLGRPRIALALDRANGVYFSGGGQRRLVSAMGSTRFDECLRQRHHEGLHVGGTSAGASAMSTVMIAGDGRDPVQQSPVELSTGFGLLPEVIVDQHFQQRERFSRLIAAVRAQPRDAGVWSRRRNRRGDRFPRACRGLGRGRTHRRRRFSTPRFEPGLPRASPTGPSAFARNAAARADRGMGLRTLHARSEVAHQTEEVRARRRAMK